MSDKIKFRAAGTAPETVFEVSLENLEYGRVLIRINDKPALVLCPVSEGSGQFEGKAFIGTYSENLRKLGIHQICCVDKNGRTYHPLISGEVVE